MKTSNFPRQKLNKGFGEGNLGNEKIATKKARVGDMICAKMTKRGNL